MNERTIDLLSIPIYQEMALVVYVDVKSFFASIEAVRRGLDPLEAYIAVVSDLKRPGAVVLASSPRVKLEYNIKTGNRLFEIPKRSPIMVVEPNMALYINVNQAIQNIFRRFVTDEDLHVYSIDESILDVTASFNLFGSAEMIAKSILKMVKDELGLIVTAGIGDNPLLTKLALDNEAKEFIKRWQGEPVRSVNITAGKMVPEGHEQLELFFEGAEKKPAMDKVVDDLRERFGKKAIFYAGSMAGVTFLERADYVGGHKGKSN